MGAFMLNWLPNLAIYSTLSLVVAIALHFLSQVLFRINSNEPPVVFHWIPFVGNAVGYGIDPYNFFRQCQAKYGNVFTFILFGRRVTVCLGVGGNEFILNGKLKDVNAEEVYGHLTTPVFGSGVVYDCPNSKLMEQKKFVKFGLTTEALKSYATLIENEVKNYSRDSLHFKGDAGIVNIGPAMAELTIFTASCSLQGAEVRSKLNSSFADLYHDLDLGFTPINFFMPWAPLPRNRKRDRAQRKMREVYMEIINARRKPGCKKDSEDMLWHLMECKYKNGQTIPDHEIAHMMITLLMAGQHSSSAMSAWIMLRLASRPDIMEELYEEQIRELGADLPPLQLDHLSKLTLSQQVVKETLRMHSSIHSIMRKAMNPLAIPGTNYVVPMNNILLASPGFTARDESHFKNADTWDPHRWDDNNNTNVVDEGETVDYGYGEITKGTKSPYLPFGAGRHRCIGEQFAYLNLGVIVATIVREFKFRNPDGVTGVVDTDYSSLFSRPLEPALIHWERRNAKVKSV